MGSMAGKGSFGANAMHGGCVAQPALPELKKEEEAHMETLGSIEETADTEGRDEGVLTKVKAQKEELRRQQQRLESEEVAQVLSVQGLQNARMNGASQVRISARPESPPTPQGLGRSPAEERNRGEERAESYEARAAVETEV